MADPEKHRKAAACIRAEADTIHGDEVKGRFLAIARLSDGPRRERRKTEEAA
jgi:hypothetical protein